MDTKIWGPPGWLFLFSCIAGRYPETIEPSNSEHILIKSQFKVFLSNLSGVMPCVYCRDSLTIFQKDIPIDKYLDGKRNLMYWLYLIKDKVNRKLLCQERIKFAENQTELVKMLNSGEISRQTYMTLLNESREKIMTTVESPSFEDVLSYYDTFRVSCTSNDKAMHGKCTK